MVPVLQIYFSGTLRIRNSHKLQREKSICRKKHWHQIFYLITTILKNFNLLRSKRWHWYRLHTMSEFTTVIISKTKLNDEKKKLNKKRSLHHMRERRKEGRWYSLDAATRHANKGPESSANILRTLPPPNWTTSLTILSQKRNQIQKPQVNKKFKTLDTKMTLGFHFHLI